MFFPQSKNPNDMVTNPYHTCPLYIETLFFEVWGVGSLDEVCVSWTLEFMIKGPGGGSEFPNTQCPDRKNGCFVE